MREVLGIVEDATGTRLDVEWAAARDSDVDAIVLDTTRLRSLVDWSPVPLDEGVGGILADWGRAGGRGRRPA